MNNYFSNIVSGIQTIFEGMSITFATLFAKRLSVQYPEVDISSEETIVKKYPGELMGMAENYRGILDLNLSLCTACQICMRTCPIDCIIIESAKCDKTKLTDSRGEPVKNRFTQKDALKTRASLRFDINIGKCMFCGLCEDACPTGAIQHTNKFEMNRDNLSDLVLRFISDEEKLKVETRAREIEEEAAAKKAEEEAKKKEQAEEEAKKKEHAEAEATEKETE